MKTHFVTFCAFVYLCLAVSRGAVPRDFAVDLKAMVSDTSPYITLSWTQRVQSNISAQKIHRRLKGQTTWVKLADLTTTQTSYIDSTAVPGVEYEYWMERTLTGLTPSTAQGYLAAGVKVPPIHTRGKLLLVVDSTMETPLAGEISQLRLDLAADGWEVRTIIAPRSGTGVNAASTKALIKAEYDLDPANVKAVYLLGHVPVPYSGNHGPDGHSDHVGAWPADGYYGEMNGTWNDTSVNNTSASRTQNDNIPGDGKFDLTYFNSLVELQVGRVDLHTMTKAPTSGVTEVQRLRRYLKRAHDFRHKQGAYAAIPRRTLIRDGFGHAFSSEPFAMTAWAGAFSAVGGTIEEAPSGQWFFETYAGGKDYLWGHGCGGGSYESASSLGSTTDFGRKPSRVVFTSIFGSYHGDWDADNNLMRSAIAGNADGNSLGLCCFWAGRPGWFPHPLGMGETLGYMARATMNAGVTGGGTYRPSTSSFSATHIGLMGDPALRIHAVEPPRNLAATSSANTVSLSWTASTETGLAGYHVYRADNAAGPFVRLTTDPLTATTTTFTDDSALTSGNNHLYLVRTMKLESVPGGSYYNLSTGSAAGITVNAAPEGLPWSPGNVAVAAGSPGLNVTWTDNSDNETGFRIERKTGGTGTYAEIATTGADITSLTDAGPLAQGTVYYYRVTALGAGGDSFPSGEAGFETIAGLVEFTAGRAKVSKAAGTVTLTVAREGGGAGTVSVNYATANSTATAGTHYTSTTGTLTWTDGDTTDRTITVPVTNTAQPQLPRQFKLTLSSPTSGLLLGVMPTIAVQIEDPTATLDSPWTGAMLGSITDSSPAVSAEGVIGDSTMGGSGAVQDATAEAGRFIYQTKTGDQVISVRVPTGTIAQSSSRFAVMVRASTATNAVMAATVTANSAANYGARSVTRLTAGGAAADTPDADNHLDTTRWLRVWRSGSTFVSETSADGVAWTTLASTSIPNMPPAAMWGIFHYSAAPNADGYADYQLASYTNVTVDPLPLPTTPANFVAGTLATNSVPLTWTFSPYAASLRLDRQGGDGSVKQFTIAGSATTYTDTTVRPDTRYTYQLTAVNNRADSSPAALTGMTPTTDGSPLRPGYVAMAELPGGLSISWPPYLGTGQSGFAIERMVANGSWTPLAEVAGNATSHLDPSALPGMRCLYRVRALRGAEISAWMTPTLLTQDDTLLITGAVRAQGNGGYEITAGSFAHGALSLKYSAALTAYGLGHTAARTRSDASGWFGMELRTGASTVEVRELGRFVLPGNTATHAVKLVNADTAAQLASVTVITAGAPANAFKYTALPSPVTLAANSRYFLLSQETAGGDAWPDLHAMAPGTATGYQLWLLSQGLPMDGSGAGAATAIANGSGPLPNLVKYALGLPTDAPGNGGRMSHAMVEDISGAYLTFSFTHPFPAPEGVSYTVESCPTLSDWGTTGIVPVGETTNGGLRTVTVKVQSADPAKCFVRLKVVRSE